MNESSDTQRQAIFAALADPMRRRLLETLAEHSPRTATQLAGLFPITRQGILKHLTVLEDAGLVVVQQVGRDKRYSLVTGPLGALEQWVSDLEALWDRRLLRLKRLIEDDLDSAEEG
jgi:DNA-binding transcriptional ArsR family regulator